MKTLKCDLCEVTAEGETFEAWLSEILPHYLQTHADEIDPKTGLSGRDKVFPSLLGKVTNTWLTENRARFETA